MVIYIRTLHIHKNIQICFTRGGVASFVIFYTFIIRRFEGFSSMLIVCELRRQSAGVSECSQGVR